jgi:hypothetical protein
MPKIAKPAPVMIPGFGLSTPGFGLSEVRYVPAEFDCPELWFEITNPDEVSDANERLQECRELVHGDENRWRDRHRAHAAWLREPPWPDQTRTMLVRISVR